MAKYIDPTVYVISISDDVRKRLQSIRKYVVPGWIHSKLKRLYSLVIVFILACFLVHGWAAMADTQYCYTSQRKGLSPIVSDGLHVFVCDIQKHILTTECTVYDVSQCNNKRVFTKTGNLFWIACDKNQVLLKVGYSGGILDKLVRKIGVYLYTSDYGVEHKADYTIDYSIPRAKNKEVELVCAGLIEISTESDALGCDQFTIKTCGNGDCLYSGVKKGSLFVFDTFALWEDNKGSILLFDYEGKKEYEIFDEARRWINLGKFGGIIINGALIYKTDEGLFLWNLENGNKETIIEKRNINMFCVYGHKLYIGVDDSIIEIDMDTKNINEYSIEQIGTCYFVVVDGICYYTTNSNYNSSIDNVRIIELNKEC